MGGSRVRLRPGLSEHQPILNDSDQDSPLPTPAEPRCPHQQRRPVREALGVLWSVVLRGCPRLPVEVETCHAAAAFPIDKSTPIPYRCAASPPTHAGGQHPRTMTRAIYDFLYGGLSMKTVGIVLGLVLLATHAFALLRKESVQRFLKDFPRNRKAGIVLLLIDAFLAWVLMREIDMGEFFGLRGFILLLIPVATVLIILYCEEFLAVRALGTLLLLLAAPVLASAFLKPQLTRLLLPILAYAWILLGLFWVGMPYLLRDRIDWLIESAGRWKVACLAGIVYGGLLLGTAIATY